MKRRTSTPSISGRPRSSITRSGQCEVTIVIAFAPLFAEITS